MKSKIAIIVLALFPVFFAMQNCAGGGGGGSSAADQASNGTGGTGGFDSDDVKLLGACKSAVNAGCYENYGFEFLRTQTANACAQTSSAANGTWTWTNGAHCEAAPTYVFRCDMRSKPGPNVVIVGAGYLWFYPAVSASLQNSCTNGGATWSANP